MDIPPPASHVGAQRPPPSHIAPQALPPPSLVIFHASTLVERASHLQQAEQRELIAFLVSLQTEKNEDFKSTLARKIDDADPSRWMFLDDLRRRYFEQV